MKDETKGTTLRPDFCRTMISSKACTTRDGQNPRPSPGSDSQRKLSTKTSNAFLLVLGSPWSQNHLWLCRPRSLISLLSRAAAGRAEALKGWHPTMPGRTFSGYTLASSHQKGLWVKAGLHSYRISPGERTLLSHHNPLSSHSVAVTLHKSYQSHSCWAGVVSFPETGLYFFNVRQLNI